MHLHFKVRDHVTSDREKETDWLPQCSKWKVFLCMCVFAAWRVVTGVWVSPSQKYQLWKKDTFSPLLAAPDHWTRRLFNYNSNCRGLFHPVSIMKFLLHQWNLRLSPSQRKSPKEVRATAEPRHVLLSWLDKVRNTIPEMHLKWRGTHHKGFSL